MHHAKRRLWLRSFSWTRRANVSKARAVKRSGGAACLRIAEERKFLGFSSSIDGSGRRVAPEAVDKLKARTRDRPDIGLSLRQLIKELKPHIARWRDYRRSGRSGQPGETPHAIMMSRGGIFIRGRSRFCDPNLPHFRTRARSNKAPATTISCHSIFRGPCHICRS